MTHISFKHQRLVTRVLIAAFTLFTATWTNMAVAADPVQARKDIKAMGLVYTGDDFAKAAGNGDVIAVQLYIDAGMDVNSGGGAAIGLAAGRGNIKMVQFLRSKGAKPTSNALQFARTRGHIDIERVLVEAGAKE